MKRVEEGIIIIVRSSGNYRFKLITVISFYWNRKSIFMPFCWYFVTAGLCSLASIRSLRLRTAAFILHKLWPSLLLESCLFQNTSPFGTFRRRLRSALDKIKAYLHVVTRWRSRRQQTMENDRQELLFSNCCHRQSRDIKAPVISRRKRRLLNIKYWNKIFKLVMRLPLLCRKGRLCRRHARQHPSFHSLTHSKQLSRFIVKRWNILCY